MSFSEWLEANREFLMELHRNDYEEALWQAFIAGIEYFITPVKKEKTND
jgi:hypothetical protein